MKYRIHDDNLFGGRSAPKTRATRRRWARSWFAISRDWNRSWAASGRKDPVLERQLRRQLRFRGYDAECYDRSRLEAREVAFAALAQGLTLRNVGGILRRHVLRID